MKKLFFFFTIFFLTINTYSQSLEDALRFSISNPIGTARYQSMAGAFGALGGDLSSIVSNPAGSSVFTHAEIVGTLSIQNNQNKATYFGNTKENEESNLSIHQIGIVIPFRNNSNDWTKTTFAFNGQTQSFFENDYRVVGESKNGLDKYFLGYANGIGADILNIRDGESLQGVYQYLGENFSNGYNMQQALLGYQGYLINPDGEETYSRNASYTNVNHSYFSMDTGRISKYTFNLSSLYNDYLHVGVNINAYDIQYRKSNRLIESGYNANSNVQEVDFENTLDIKGGGFSVQVGAIAKIAENIRVGFSYHSPVAFTEMEEEFQQKIKIGLNDSFVQSITGAQAVINLDPETNLVFPKYNFQSPSTTALSFAYLFGQRGLISIEYDTRDYSNIKYVVDNSSYLEQLNEEASSAFQRVQNIRAGGEFRFDERISIRGGYARIQNPYKGLNDNQIVSLGLGYNNLNSYLGFSIQNIITYSQENFYNGLPTTNAFSANNYNLINTQLRLSASYHLIF